MSNSPTTMVSPLSRACALYPEGRRPPGAPRGYMVLSASSGEEALAKVASDRPDLVLLDIVMPGLNGYQVCKRLRDDPAWSYLPVVMITASEQQERVLALEAGADDFIQKPF